MIHEELSGKIIGAGMDVLNELRPAEMIPRLRDYERASAWERRKTICPRNTLNIRKRKSLCFPF